MPIQWQASMSTGVEEIDRQHQTLIQALNELMEAMRQGKGTQRISDILAFLGQYAASHFAYEERCMEQYHCPAAAVNKLAHQKFIKVFGELRQRLAKEGPTSALVMEVQRQLADWLVSHIQGTDCQLRTYVAGQQRKIA